MAKKDRENLAGVGANGNMIYACAGCKLLSTVALSLESEDGH